VSGASAAESDNGAPVKGLRRDAAENRLRLLDAAEKVFAANGLDASVEEVARVAGVGMGTLYRRFPTKDALIGELISALLGDLLALAQRMRNAPDGSGLEQFLFGTGEALALHSGCLARLWNDPETTPIKNRCRVEIEELLATAQRAGRVRRDASLTDIDLIIWSLRGVIETTQRIGAHGWRRHVAIAVAGLRPSVEELAEPALTPDEVELIRNTRR
jgi:AcrR family transcriptional regulator